LFPDINTAREDGLLAIGGDLDAETLKLAYSSGIFPWFSGKTPMWYSPDPRFVLFPHQLVVSKSMKQVLKSNKFSFTCDQAFDQVIKNCSTVKREGQWGTWITKDMIKAYTMLFNQGVVHSAETWMNGKLVGGLYGVQIGKVFCGESMFSLESNASKFAFIRFVQDVLIPAGIQLIDCQVHTPHLESMGAVMISRAKFIEYLKTS
jgi:leucyl/phenylalanyl-tRNA--protein transferase